MIRTKSDCIFNQATINRLVQKYFIFMLEVKDGSVSLLVFHWKYIDWRSKSPREFLYTGATVTDGYYYYLGENKFQKL